jgi:hypothetical protein
VTAGRIGWGPPGNGVVSGGSAAFGRVRMVGKGGMVGRDVFVISEVATRLASAVAVDNCAICTDVAAG